MSTPKCRRLDITRSPPPPVGPAQPQIGDTVDLLDTDQLLIFGPSKRPLELQVPELPLLLRGALCRRVCVELFRTISWSTIRTTGPSGPVGRSTPCSAKIVISTRLSRSTAVR